VKLPWMLFGELRRLFAASSFHGPGRPATALGSAPGVERVRAAHARLRSAALEGTPSLGHSVGRAAGAMGAPAGGPLGVARRGFAGAALRAGILPATAAAGLAGAAVGRGKPKGSERAGVRERFARAGTILRNAPTDARTAMGRGSANSTYTRSPAYATRAASTPGIRGRDRKAPAPNELTSGREPAATRSVPTPAREKHRQSGRATPRPSGPAGQRPVAPKASRAGVAPTPGRPTATPVRADDSSPPAHPGRKIAASRPDNDVQAQQATKSALPSPAECLQPQPPRPTRDPPGFSRKPRPTRDT